MTTKTILNHKLYSKSDYDYLRGKGYTNSEIIAIWNKDLGQGSTSPLVHQEIPDIVSIICGTKTQN